MIYKILDSQELDNLLTDARTQFQSELVKASAKRDITSAEDDLICLLVLTVYIVQKSLDRNNKKTMLIEESLNWIKDSRIAHSVLKEEEFRSILELLFKDLKS